MVHCRWCKKAFEPLASEENISWVLRSRNWYYHKDCYDEFLNNKNKPRTDAEWMDRGIELIKNYLHKDYDYFQIQAQWNNLIASNYTGKGIYFAMYYAFVIKKIEFQKKFGIGIIRCVYEESCKYWIEQESITQGIIEQIEKASSIFNGEKRIVKKKKKKESLDDFIDWDDI